MRFFIVLLATGFYSGYCPIAPGTCGTLLGILVYIFFSALSPFLYVLTTVATVFLAIWASSWAENFFLRKDSPCIVIDEMAGFLVTMCLLPPTWLTILLGFLFFRLFDIIKPPPARFIEEKVKGGWGIVLDDVVAGIYGNGVIHFIYFIQK